MSRLRAFVARQPYEVHALVAVLVIGFFLRLSISPLGVYPSDGASIRLWAIELGQHAPWQYYDRTYSDHLPGDLWLLWGVARIYKLFSPEMSVWAPGFMWLAKLVPIGADLGAGAMLYLVGSRFSGRGVGVIAAALFVLNPAAVFLSALWGQWDSVSIFAALAALWLFLSGRIAWAFPALTYAALVKPQFAALLPLLVLATFLRTEERFSFDAFRGRRALASVRPIAIGAALSLLVCAAILLPFNVGIGPIGAHALMDRVRAAVDHYPNTTMNALNFWAIGTPPVHEMRQGDTAVWQLGLTYHRWGMLLAGGAYVALVAAYVKRPSSLALALTAAAVMLTLFVLPTRIHERYILPAVALMALSASYVAAVRVIYIGVTITAFVNLWFAYGLTLDPRFPQALADSRFFLVFVSMLNVAMLAALVAILVAHAFGRFELQQRHEVSELPGPGHDVRVPLAAPGSPGDSS